MPVILAMCKMNRLSNSMKYLTEEGVEVEELVVVVVVVVVDQYVEIVVVVAGSEFGLNKWSR